MNSLPVEVLSVISDFLPSICVIRLSFLTCKRMLQLLTSERGVRKLCVVDGEGIWLRRIQLKRNDPILAAFPRSLLSFRGLDHLELFSRLSFDLDNPRTLQWPKRLKGLKIPVSLMWSVVTDLILLDMDLSNDPSRLSRTFPCLESISLTTGSDFDFRLRHRCIVSFMEHLPPTLTHLHVSSLYSCIMPYANVAVPIQTLWHEGDLDQLRSLSTLARDHLQSLKWTYYEWVLFSASDIGCFPQLTTLVVDASVNWSSFSSPFPSLTSLTISKSFLTPEVIITLPECLLELDIAWNSDVSGSTTILSLLPPNLTRIAWRDDRAHKFNFNELPRGLTSLRLSCVRSQNPDSLSGLPTGLTDLSLTPTKFNWEYSQLDEVHAQLKDLTSLTLSTGKLKFAKDLLLLPRKIRTLHMYEFPSFDEYCLLMLPEGVTDLEIVFPLIRAQSGECWTDHMVKYLPQQLVKLSISERWRITGILVDESATHLDELVLFNSVFKALPIGMRNRIHQECSSLNDDIMAKWKTIAEVEPYFELSELPPSVLSISLLYGSLLLNRISTKSLRQLIVENGTETPVDLILPSVESKSLKSLHFGFAMRLFTLHFKHLPPYLVELCIPQAHIVSKGKEAIQLPTTLRKVTICSLDLQSLSSCFHDSNIDTLKIIDATKLHMSHFHALPKSLTSLRLGLLQCKHNCSPHLHLPSNESPSSPYSSSSSITSNKDSMLSPSTLMALPKTLTHLDMSSAFGISGSQLSKLSKPSATPPPPKQQPGKNHRGKKKPWKVPARKRTAFADSDGDDSVDDVRLGHSLELLVSSSANRAKPEWSGLRKLSVKFVQVSLDDLNLGADSTSLNLPDMTESLVNQSLPAGMTLVSHEWKLQLTDNDALGLPVSELNILDAHHPDVSDVFLTSLPPTITKLCMPLQHGFTSDGVRNLSPHLVHLQIVAKSIKPTSLECLPKTLEYLHLMGPSGPYGESVHLAKEHTSLKTLLVDNPFSLRPNFLSRSSLPWNSLMHLRIGNAELLTRVDIVTLVPHTLQRLELFGIEANTLNLLLPKPEQHRMSPQQLSSPFSDRFRQVEGLETVLSAEPYESGQ